MFHHTKVGEPCSFALLGRNKRRCFLRGQKHCQTLTDASPHFKQPKRVVSGGLLTLLSFNVYARNMALSMKDCCLDDLKAPTSQLLGHLQALLPSEACNRLLIMAQNLIDLYVKLDSFQDSCYIADEFAEYVPLSLSLQQRLVPH